jgi:eukaryotic-like serine/threonine-protein kinase
MVSAAPTDTLTSELHTGSQLDHYQIEGVVARSGMASIFRARDTRDGRQVAIKVPHPEMECDPALFDRFKREEQIGMAMDHPGVMRVYGDDDRGQVYMVMEWVDGTLLRKILNEKGKLPPERAVRLAVRILQALDYIHQHGVVHRDLKPENIMVDDNDNIKLIDFGIASAAGARRLTFAKLSSTLGTPDYISPEQVKGKRGDARSDLYSLGIMLYEMLTGKVPFVGDSAFAIMNDRLMNNPIPPREIDPSITPQLQEIIYRALERDPKNRYPNAHEFIHDLERPDKVGVAERVELKEWKSRKKPMSRRILFYIGLALIPIIVFALLFWVARHG